MKNVQIFLLICFILIVDSNGLCGNHQGQTEEIVQRFNAALRNMPNVFAIEAKTKYLTNTGELKQLTDIKYYCDGKCIDVEHSVHNYSLVNGKTDKTSDVPFYQRSMVDRKNRAFYYDSEREDRAPEYVIFWSDGEKEFNDIKNKIGIGRALEGYVTGDRISLIELFSEKTSSLRYKGLENIDGSECHVLEATIENYGNYTLWLDQKHNCLPRNVSVVKKGEDIYGIKPVSEMKLSHGAPTEISFVMDSVKFKDFNGVLLPIECKTTLIWKYKDGETAEWYGEHERLSVNFHPDFEALNAFEPNIPNGTRVNHQDFIGKDTRFEWRNGEVVNIYIQPLPLIGKVLPDLKDLGLNLSPADVNDKLILLCFFDMEQRPSRNCVQELSKKAKELKEKGIVTIAVQASKIEQATLNEWIKENNISFPVGLINDDSQKTHSAWGVKSLPWMILADKNHIVTAEGFNLDELDGKIRDDSEKPGG